MNINSSNNFIRPNFTANVMPKNCAEYINNKLKSAKTVDTQKTHEWVELFKHSADEVLSK